MQTDSLIGSKLSSFLMFMHFIVLFPCAYNKSPIKFMVIPLIIEIASIDLIFG